MATMTDRRLKTWVYVAAGLLLVVSVMPSLWSIREDSELIWPWRLLIWPRIELWRPRIELIRPRIELTCPLMLLILPFSELR